MIRFLIALTLLFSNNLIQAQNPLEKQWDQRFGGSGEDYLNDFHETFDKGFILGGSSYSPISGDKTQANWDTSNAHYDYWIVKTDSLGNKQWDKRFGGELTDYLYRLEQTKDEGYILGGMSKSGIDGDKTEPSRGDYDYWIVKTDSVGNKLWDKRFGGTNFDALFALQETTDGGYILGGTSQSDAGGDKTEQSRGNDDYWIVKTDSSGNKQWDKRFGGDYTDQLKSIQQTTDGGFILGGWSLSGISGDKTQANWDTITGQSDFWILKTDSLGNKLWDKRFGGTRIEELSSIQITNDGGFILGGFSRSEISGDKSEDCWNNSSDYWIIKIDSLGIKQWDKRFGGTDSEDEVGEITMTNDAGYLISGRSFSQTGGNKTEDNLGIVQTWMIKTDSLGMKQWDKTIFSPGYDNSFLNYGLSTQTKDGCFVTANYTPVGIGGYKTQASRGRNDFWMVKLCDTSLTSNTHSVINDKNSTISIFPNPFTNELFIRIRKENISGVSFSINNLLGEHVFYSLENNLSTLYTKLIDLSFLVNGVYIVDVTLNNEHYRRKIIKQ